MQDRLELRAVIDRQLVQPARGLRRMVGAGSLPPTNQNTDGTCQAVPEQPKSSLAGAGPVSFTRSGEKWARNAAATRSLATASLTFSG
jgi:hypothetical protein